MRRGGKGEGEGSSDDEDRGWDEDDEVVDAEGVGVGAGGGGAGLGGSTNGRTGSGRKFRCDKKKFTAGKLLKLDSRHQLFRSRV